MKKITFLPYLIILAVICGVAIWWLCSPEVDRVKVSEGKISDIKPMVQLCALEVYEDVPVRGDIDSRHLFAKTALNGYISFDLEKLATEERGDTLRVILPPEVIEVRESTDDGAYRVIDAWNDDFFGSSNITTAEENAFKTRAQDNFRKGLYSKGYVKRARSEAVTNLTSMLSALTGRPVVVVDPTPEGAL